MKQLGCSVQSQRQLRDFSHTLDYFQGVAILMGAAVAGLLAGCASTPEFAGLPLGEWSGHGLVAYEYWGENEEASSETDSRRSIHRSYATTLRILPTMLEDHNVVELEIVSNSGLPDLVDKIHVRLALEKAKQASESIVLYRLVDLLLNPEPDETLEFKEGGVQYAASFIILNGVAVLQIQYADNYIDTFRFTGNRLEKQGVYYSEDGLIHWVEQLTRDH